MKRLSSRARVPKANLHLHRIGRFSLEIKTVSHDVVKNCSYDTTVGDTVIALMVGLGSEGGSDYIAINLERDAKTPGVLRAADPATSRLV
jgi:hypothetical protein